MPDHAAHRRGSTNGSPVPPTSAATGGPPRPLLVTDDPFVLDAVLRLAATARVEVDLAATVERAGGRWSSAPLVLVGHDQVRSIAATRLPRRRDVVLVSLHLDDAEVWERGRQIGAGQIIFLPDAQEWLLDTLSGTDPRRRASVVGVVGGCGGAGATTLAVALAVTAARRRLRTVLIDADPFGGGIDLAVGAESAPGPRWNTLLASAERWPPVRGLAETLPRAGHLPVLSWRPHPAPPLPPEAMTATVSGLRRDRDLLVIDLPRVPDPAALAALSLTTVTLVVIPAELRAAAAALRVCTAVSEACPDVRVVIRDHPQARLSADVITDALALPLAGVLGREPGLVESMEQGRAPASRRRGPLATFCSYLLADLGLGAGGGVATAGPDRADDLP